MRIVSLGWAARRIGVAATLAVAVVVAMEGGSQARSLDVQTPSLTVGVSGVTVDVPPARVTAPVAPVDASQPAPPAPPVPSVRLDPSSLPVKPPTAPGGRALPATPLSPPARSAPPANPSQSNPSQSGASPPASGDSAAVGSALAGATPGATRFPSRSELAELPSGQRRELLRLAFDTPLRKQRLRQLRSAIGRYRGCLAALPARGRRALELRAGLFGEEPASRREIARRIGTSPSGALRLERSSLARLTSAGERGLCGGSSTAAAALGGPASGSDGPTAGPSSEGDPRPAGGVLADVREGGPGVDLGDGEQGPAETLLFLLLTLGALLGPLAVITVLSRRRSGSGAAAATGAGERPLLFLDVDGVLALDPLSTGLPPGRMCALPVGLAYVPDRAGKLVRELATRFDLVWATGWEHHANTRLLRRLGLREELPVLTFGGKARYGSSTWKIKPVKDYAGHRPAAWLDDHFVGRHERWAAHRPEPTLLVHVDPDGGLTPDHVERLLRWADRLERPPTAERDGQRRLRAS